MHDVGSLSGPRRGRPSHLRYNTPVTPSQELTPQTLTELWEQRWPECPPFAHRLRVQYPDRWARFHSLPGSKRYPADESEYAALLDRHYTTLSELKIRPCSRRNAGHRRACRVVPTWSPGADALDDRSTRFRAGSVQKTGGFRPAKTGGLAGLNGQAIARTLGTGIFRSPWCRMQQ
ncbi:DUF3885 domain-containing protein [Micromonospora sp. DT31]